MTYADANDVEIIFTRQTGFKTGVGGSPDYRVLNRTDITAFGNSYGKAEPTRISKNRNRNKKRVISAESGAEISAPMDYDTMVEFAGGFTFSLPAGVPKFRSTASTTTTFTVPAVSAADADKITSGATLVMARGFENEANNGLKVVTSAVAENATAITVGGLTAETIANTKRAEVAVAGYRGAAGDFGIDADGNLISTPVDLTTLGLAIGQAIYIGGDDDLNNFDDDANRGFALVKAIEAGKITLSHRDSVYVPEAAATQTVDILFGQYFRNYRTTDPLNERIFYQLSQVTQFQEPSSTIYENAHDNVLDSLSIELGDEFANITLGFVGTITDKPTETAATGQVNAAPMTTVGSFSTATDLIRLAISNVDEEGLLTDFNSMTLTLSNNTTRRRSLASLAATQLNIGKIDATAEWEGTFTDKEVIEAVRCDHEFDLRFPLWNVDGGLYVRIPKLTLEDDSRSYPENETVTISGTGVAFNDDPEGASIEFSSFPFMPTRACA